jgi:phage tail sheath gpL-like
MGASIVLTGVGSSFFTPGGFLEINFAKGVSAGYQGQRLAILVANATSAGTAVRDTKIYGPDTDVPCQTETDVINLGGPGSEAHRGWRRWTRVNRTTPLYLLFVTESTGTAATLNVTIATTAAASGFLRFWCTDEFVDQTIATGDTPTVIATALAALINAQTDWPITATPTAGVLAVTAKEKGPRGNDIKVQANIFSSGTILTTVDTGSSTALASGATADSNTTALATLLPKLFYHIVSAANDATQLDALVAQVNAQALPTVGIRQRVWAGFSGTLANSITLATGQNAARSELAWQKSSDLTPFEIACSEAAAIAAWDAGKAPRPLHNFDGFGNSSDTQPYWAIPAPRSGVSPTPAEIESALHNGVSPIASNQNGTTYLVSRITTRSLNGSTPDYRTKDAHKVSVCDYFADDVLQIVRDNFQGKDIADDPAVGQPVPSGEQVNSQVVTPRVFKAALFRVIDDHNEDGQLQHVDVIKANTIVQRETSPTTRMSARVPLQPIDVLHQVAIAVDQVA